MKLKKLIGIFSGICGILSGIAILFAVFMEKPFPKPLWILFALVCIVNAIGIIINYHTSKQSK